LSRKAKPVRRTSKKAGESFICVSESVPSRHIQGRTTSGCITVPRERGAHRLGRKNAKAVAGRSKASEETLLVTDVDAMIESAEGMPISFLAEQDEERSEGAEQTIDSSDPIVTAEGDGHQEDEQLEAAEEGEAVPTDDAIPAIPDSAECCDQQANDVLISDDASVLEPVDVAEISPVVVAEELAAPFPETDEQPVEQVVEQVVRVEEPVVEQIDLAKVEVHSITERLVQYLEQNEDPRIAWMESKREPEHIGSVAELLSDSDEVAMPMPEGNLDGLLFEVLTDLIEFEDVEVPADDSAEELVDKQVEGQVAERAEDQVEDQAEDLGEEDAPAVDAVAYERLYDAMSRDASFGLETGAMSELLSEALCGLLPNGRSWDAPRIRRKKKRRRRKRASEQARRRRKERPRRTRVHHIKVETRPLGKKKKKRKLTDFLPLLGLLVAVAIFAWPVVSDAYKQWAYSQTISEGYSYDWEDPKYQEILEQANLYNKMLAGRLPADVDVNSIWPYEKQLDYGSGGMIAWVEIPDLSLKLPIYHGSNDESLMAGVGHMERTSLPVGGDHTKCAISGHTGMQNERMFDSLDDLEKDDVVIIHALGKDLYYSVTYKEVVEPTALDKLYIDCEDSQLVLITCTPRGINSHRLLVHATQVDEESTQVTDINPMDAVMNYLLSPTVIFFTVMMLVLLVLFLLWLLRWRKKKASVKVEELDEYTALTTKLLEEGLDVDDDQPDR
jgi:sortase A